MEQINTVLCTIIPGMRIEDKDYGQQALDSGEDGWKIELMSVREGKRPIPIRMESEGIIKIISILNALIQAFANPSICLVIDELDAGIFEYMLGELLDIFQKSAKGQLILLLTIFGHWRCLIKRVLCFRPLIQIIDIFI